MRISNKVLTFCVACAATLIPSSVLMASPLEPSRVPADAKWVVHVDLEAVAKTQLADRVRENRRRLLMPVRMWLQNKYGIDLREGLDSVTLYGHNYEPHSGTLILRADYDRDKVQAKLESKPGVQKETRGEFTFYKVSTSKSPASLSTTGRPQASDTKASSRERQTQTIHQNDHPMTIVLVDSKTVVFASSDDAAQAAIALAKPRADAVAVKTDSPLLSHHTKGTILYGAARDLGEIKQRDGFFPVLSQHEQIYVSVGIQNEQVVKDVTLIARNTEVAENMQKAVEGLNAFGLVWAADSEALATVIKDREITREGKTVRIKGHSDRETVGNAAEELWERVMYRFNLDESESPK